MTKVSATKIVLNRAEGPSHLCDRPQEVVGPNVWDRANKVLCDWSHTAPVVGSGYDKCYFTVFYSDGSTYGPDRYDLNSGAGYPNLAHGVLASLNCVSGRKIPSHISHKAWGAMFAGKNEEIAANFLDTHEIGD